jgi:hypothetical protein
MGHPPAETFDAVEFDPEAVLERESRILLDPHFLGALHEELRDELGPGEASITLFQMGFLHGLQDAARAVASAVDTRLPAARAAAIVPPLAMRCRTRPGAGPAGAIEVVGSWPERCEAAAHLASQGATSGPVCALSAGYTSGWLSGTLDADLLALEVECSAVGHPGCRFVARETEVWRALGDEVAGARMDRLPFASFRSLVRQRQVRSLATRVTDGRGDAIDRDAAVVHIWGPVMVMPYTGPEEAMQAVSLIGGDPGASEVSVVVIDLGGAVVDDAFGALALEQIVRAIEAWGAEAILADPSPLSQAVVANLEHPPLFVLKDLDEAISRAFQIAQSQRRLV